MQQNHGGLYRFNLFVGAPPAPPYVNVGRVYYGGGHPEGTFAPTNNLEKYDIFNDAVTALGATLFTARHGLFGFGGDFYGLFYGGRNNVSNTDYDTADKLSYATETRIAFMTVSGYKMSFGGGFANEAAGYSFGGSGVKTSDNSALDFTTQGIRFEFSNERSSVFASFLSNGSKYGAGGSSRTIGVVTLGQKTAGGNTDRTALRFSFVDNALFATNGVLNEGHAQHNILSAPDYAYIFGGFELVAPGGAQNISTIEKTQFSGSVTANVAATLAQPRQGFPGAGGNADMGVMISGYAGPANYLETIEKMDYSSETLTVSPATISAGKEGGAAVSSKTAFYDEPGTAYMTASGYMLLTGSTIGIFGHDFNEQFAFTEKTTRSGTPNLGKRSEHTMTSNATTGLLHGFTAIGGATTEKFSFASETWANSASNPDVYLSNRAVAGNASFAIFGPGFDSFGAPAAKTIKTHKYTYASDIFVNTTAAPEAKISYSAAANADVAAFFGGYAVGQTAGTNRFRFSDNTHTATQNLSSARRDSHAAGNGVSARIVSGEKAGSLDDTTTERYSFAGGSIEVMSAYLFPRNQGGAASNPNLMESFGGYNDNDGRVGWINEYNFADGTFAVIEQALAQSYGLGAAFSSNPAFGDSSVQWGEVPDGVAQPAGYGGIALIAGGYSNVNTTRKYSFSSDATEAGTNLTSGRYGGGAAGNRTFGLLFGGTVSPTNYSTSTEKYTYASQASAPASVMGLGRTFCESAGNETRAITTGGDTNSGLTTNGAENYVYADNSRAVLSSMVTGRRSHTPFASATIGYFSGGENYNINDGFVDLNTTERYNFASGARSNGSNQIRPGGRQSGLGMSGPSFAILAGDNDTGSTTNMTEKYTYSSDVVTASTNLVGSVSAENGASTSNPQIGLIRHSNATGKVDKYAFNDDTTYQVAGFIESRNSPLALSSNPGNF